MTKQLKKQGSCICGPYKGFHGRAEYDDDAGFFHGQVIGTRDVITFQAPTFERVVPEFKASVDDYLAFCKEREEKPEKPFSGNFVARIAPELHRELSTLAQLSGKSLNQFVSDRLTELVGLGVKGSPPEGITLARMRGSEAEFKPAKKAKKKRPKASQRGATKRKKEYA